MTTYRNNNIDLGRVSSFLSRAASQGEISSCEELIARRSIAMAVLGSLRGVALSEDRNIETIKEHFERYGRQF